MFGELVRFADKIERILHFLRSLNVLFKLNFIQLYTIR